MKFAKPSIGRASALIALATAALAARPAPAVEMGFYMASDYGKTRFDRSAAEYDVDLEPFLGCYFADAADFFCEAPADVQKDHSSMGRKAKSMDFWVGYQFNHWFAVEGAFLDTGKLHHTFTGSIDRGPLDLDHDGTAETDGPQPLVVRTTFRTRGVVLAAVGNFEVGEYLSFDARAGFFFADNILKLKFGFPATGEDYDSYKTSDGKTPFFMGASANFWITPYFAIRGGINTSSKGAFSEPVKQYYVGVRYSYGY